MGFARARVCAAAQRDVALLGDEPAADEVAHQLLVDRRAFEGEVIDWPKNHSTNGPERLDAEIKR